MSTGISYILSSLRAIFEMYMQTLRGDPKLNLGVPPHTSSLRVETTRNNAEPSLPSLLKASFVDDVGNGIWAAVIGGSTVKLEELLDGAEACDVNWTNPSHYGHTPLHCAVKKCSIESIRMLLSHPDIDTNKADYKGLIPIHYAASNHASFECLKLLIAHPKSQINKLDRMGISPIHYAAIHDSSFECFEALATHPDVDINVCDRMGVSPLQYAVSKNSIKCLNILIRHPHLNVNLANETGFSALHTAAFRGFLDCVRVLCGHREININQIDTMDGDTALHCATDRDHPKCVHVLVSHHRCDVNQKNAVGETPILSSIVTSGKVECLKVLLSHPKIDVNCANHSGQSPLHRCMKHGLVEVAQLLLENPSIDVNKVDKMGRTALQLASERGHVECIKLMTALPDLDVNKADGEGRTSLLHAVKRGHVDCVRSLLTHRKCDVNFADDGGRTPMHHAIIEGSIDCIKTLASCRSLDVNKHDRNGLSSMHFSALTESSYERCAITSCILLAAGADPALNHENLVSGAAHDLLESIWCERGATLREPNGGRSILAAARAAYLDMEKHGSWTPLMRAAWISHLNGCLELIRGNGSLRDTMEVNSPKMLRRDHNHRSALDVYGTAPFTFPPLDHETRQADVALIVTELKTRRDRIWARRWPLLDALTGSSILLTAFRVAQLPHVDSAASISPILRDNEKKNWNYLLHAVFGNISILRRIAAHV